MHTLVTYDISSDEIQTKLVNRLFDYGLKCVRNSALRLNTLRAWSWADLCLTYGS
jgi:CRISPR/Cas system-associated endoribonuclease Cas2